MVIGEQLLWDLLSIDYTFSLRTTHRKLILTKRQNSLLENLFNIRIVDDNCNHGKNINNLYRIYIYKTL